MSALTKSPLNNIVRAFPGILNKKCWSLSNGKVPWDYSRGFGLTWSDCDLLETFWQASDRFYDKETHGAGLGLFLGVQNQIACLDLDGTLVDGKMPSSDTAQRIINGSCTFTEVSLSGRGLHLFFEVDVGTEPFHLRTGISAKDGDFFTQKRFILLTGNIFGKEYPVRYLPAKHVQYFREQFGKTPDKPTLKKSIRKIGNGTGGTLADKLGMSVASIGYPAGATQRGPELRGGHPFHGSTSGSNFSIDINRNIWHCFRCNSGGGPLELYAVSKDIISCADCVPGALDGHWKEIFQALKDDGFDLNRAGIIVVPSSISEIKMRVKSHRRGLVPS